MTFAAPLFLLALPLWAVLAWHVWRRTQVAGQVREVPSLQHWPRESESVSPRRREMPATWVLVMLAALMLAIVGLSGPGILLGSYRVPITVDNGLTMAADGRVVSGIDQLRLWAGPDAVLDIEHLPREEPTIADTTAALEKAARDGRVLVTDRNIPGAIVITPVAPAGNAWIEWVGVDQPPTGPAGEVLVVTDGNLGGAATLTLNTDEGETRRDFTLLAGRHEYRFQLDPPARERITAILQAGGDRFLGDDHFHFAIAPPVPRLVVEPDAPALLERFAEAFNETRQPADDAAKIAMISVSESTAKPRDERSESPDLRTRASGESLRSSLVFEALEQRPSLEFATSDAPISDPIEIIDPTFAPALTFDWTEADRVTAETPPVGFRSIAVSSDHVILAINEAEPRRVWLGVGGERFESSPATVQGLADLVDWLNGGPSRWRATWIMPTADGPTVEAAWRTLDNLPRPGVFAPPRPLPPAVLLEQFRRSFPLAGILLAMATTLVIVAVLLRTGWFATPGSRNSVAD